jgi:hypothetical protein
MKSQTLLQQAIFPDTPRDNKIADQNGNIMPYWTLFYDLLTTALQLYFKPEGFLIPSQTSSNIASFMGSGVNPLANILYNSTINQFVGNILNSAIPSTEISQFWLPFAMIVTNAGNPNGVVPGYVPQLCLDTTGTVLYVCTTAGDAASAVWTST